MDDVRLLARARRGDEDAFSALFGRYQARIYRYAAHMCGPDAADDVVQETFMAIIRGSDRFDPAKGTFAAYLFGIARHMVSRRLASENGPESSEQIDERGSDRFESHGASPLDRLAAEETADAVRAAIRSLPLVFREVVILCELQEMDYTETATILRCPVGTVRSRLHRARSLLSAKLMAMEPVRRRQRAL